MTVGIDSKSSDLLEDVVVDPSRISLFQVPTPARRFSDTVTKPMKPLWGLQELGPYDVNTTDRHMRRTFDSCEVLAAYPEGDESTLEDTSKLVSYLDEGYHPKGQYDASLDPFADVFRLDNVVLDDPDEFITYDIADLGGFNKEVTLRTKEVHDRGNLPIVLVAVHSHRTVSAGRDIYIPIKRLLNRNDIPSQFLSEYPTDHPTLGVLSQIRQGKGVGWAVWNVALAMYTKLGGIPWAVTQSGKPEEHIDLTIGLRFARLPEGELGFCLGIATILDRFGRLIGTVPLENAEYHQASDTPIAGMTLSADSAKKLVTGALDSVLLDPRTQAIMQARRPLSIVFHKLGPGQFHTDEMDGISAAIEAKLPGRKAWVAFVPIVSAETLAAFGPPSQGRSIREGQGIKLDRRTALLYTVASERQFHAPITVKLQNIDDSDCAFQTVDQACSHVQTLCGLHWQTVVSGRLKLPADLDFALSIARGFANDVQPRPRSWLWKTQWYL